MTYLRQPHTCDLPYPDVAGTVWKCDNCGTIWRASVPGNPNYAKWYRVGWLLRRLLGLDK